MLFVASTARTFVVPADPDRVAAYFSRNEALLGKLLRTGRVTHLEGDLYRVTLGEFSIPGLRLRPELEIEFIDRHHETIMRTTRSRVLEGLAGLELAVQFEGSARFDDHSLGCKLISETNAQVTIEAPSTPRFAVGWLQAAGSAVLQRALELTAARFEHLIVEHFRQRAQAA